MSRNIEDAYATDEQLLAILAEASELDGPLSPAEEQLVAEIAAEAQARGLI